MTQSTFSARGQSMETMRYKLPVFIMHGELVKAEYYSDPVFIMHGVSVIPEHGRYLVFNAWTVGDERAL